MLKYNDLDVTIKRQVIVFQTYHYRNPRTHGVRFLLYTAPPEYRIMEVIRTVSTVLLHHRGIIPQRQAKACTPKKASPPGGF